MQKYPYVMCDGGPHILLPAAHESSWRAVAPLDVMNPRSDYGRAGAATANKQMALIKVGTGQAMVLDGPPFSSWGTSNEGLVEVYYLHSWTGTNLDALIDTATAAVPIGAMTDTGQVIVFPTDDAFLLYAGDSVKSSMYGYANVKVAAGNYRILLGTYNGPTGQVSIYRLQPVTPQSNEVAEEVDPAP